MASRGLDGEAFERTHVMNDTAMHVYGIRQPAACAVASLSAVT
jgi:hypothetical protein